MGGIRSRRGGRVLGLWSTEAEAIAEAGRLDEARAAANRSRREASDARKREAIPRLRQRLLGVVPGRLRRVGPRRYLVPDSAQWADWSEPDAIAFHGVRLPDEWGPDQVVDMLIRAWWDDDEASDDPSYDELFGRAAACVA